LKEPSTKLIGEVFSALRSLVRGNICEFKVVKTAKDVHILITSKQKIGGNT